MRAHTMMLKVWGERHKLLEDQEAIKIADDADQEVLDTELYNLAELEQEIEAQDFQLILKTNSLCARAYMESPFFYISLLLGKSFILVQNAERANELFLRFEGKDPETKENSGIALLHFLLTHI